MNPTPKQAAFAQNVIAGMSYSDAYRAAYDCAKMKTATVNRKASELMRNGKIAAIVENGRAEAAKAAFAVVGEKLGDGGVSRGKVVLATVHGDVHDIGKNIVKVVAQSHGYEVIDLGKDVEKERVVEAERSEQPLAVGLSALMTTTVASMEETIAALRRAGCKAKIFVGGAVLNAELAAQIGADFYTADAPAFAAALDKLQ